MLKNQLIFLKLKIHLQTECFANEKNKNNDKSGETS